MGGGVGLAAVTDISVASSSAFFALSEVRVGLIPATISPFVLRRIGATAATEMMLTGDKVPARDAQRMGLVNRVVPPEELDAAVDALAASLLRNAPEALGECRKLLRHVQGLAPHEARE
jgi:methylglutaconyl-CoA hydratase